MQKRQLSVKKPLVMKYDDLNPVVSRVRKDLKSQEVTEETFQYDAACNVVKSNEMGQSFQMTYDKNNCLTSYEGVTPEFDKDDPDVAYLYFPGHPREKIENIIESQIRLCDFINNYKGPDIYLDMDQGSNLIGIEILG